MFCISFLFYVFDFCSDFGFFILLSTAKTEPSNQVKPIFHFCFVLFGLLLITREVSHLSNKKQMKNRTQITIPTEPEPWQKPWISNKMKIFT